MSPRLSVFIPVFNEEATVERLLDAVEARPEVSELVIVDDGSTDRTPDLLASRSFIRPTKVFRHAVNSGKGAAIRSAIAEASADVALIQDADLEYDPSDYPKLLAPFERPGVTAVFGTRSFTSHSAYSFWFVMGNKVVTLWTNLLFNTYLSDIETCYKVMPLSLWRGLGLRANGFAIEPEITARLLRQGHRIYEVPISYVARPRQEGKKLTWLDGVKALGVLASLRVGAENRGATVNGAARERVR
jgi:glycosyltransferase involved in cell wall biosynthesis